MIARMWSGTTWPDRVDGYVAHLREKTFSQLRTIDGHRGAYILLRPSNGIVQVIVITLWDSVESIRTFSGDDLEAAVVPPGAQTLLASWDARATHWQVAHQPNGVG